jgi:hypothetical protein
METWTKHTTGATTLMQLRGKKKLLNKTGHLLFVHLRN